MTTMPQDSARPGRDAPTNVDRLLAAAQRSEPPDPAFVDQIRRVLARSARTAAASRAKAERPVALVAGGKHAATRADHAHSGWQKSASGGLPAQPAHAGEARQGTGLRDEVTRLLHRMGENDEDAASEVFAAIYDTLRVQASVAMRSQPRNHTLQPTALANEAFLKLVQQDVDWNSRAHFLGVAAKAMRSILVDHAKTKSRRKRKATGRRVQLDGLLIAFEDRACELLELDEALMRLAQRHERAARVVELRFFGGLDFREVAHLIGMPIRTIERDWVFARAWLHAELS